MERIVAQSIVSDPESDSEVVELDYDERHRRRFAMRTLGGKDFLLDLPKAVALADGDGLALSDGSTVIVRARGERLVEIRAGNGQHLTRIAWHLGNRHLPAEIGIDRIRIRFDHVIVDMLRGLGADVREIDAPFHPESGAYAHDH